MQHLATLCKVCGIKQSNVIHNLACREKHPLAWFVFDYIKAMVCDDKDAKLRAIDAYRGGL